MKVRITVFSENETLLKLVGEFAHGLGCIVDAATGSDRHSLRTELPDAGDSLLELLNYVALATTKAGVHTSEPLCHVTYWHPGAAAEVTLGLRVVDFGLGRTSAAGL